MNVFGKLLNCRKNRASKTVALTVIVAMLALLLMPAFSAGVLATSAYPTSKYDFEDIEYNHTPTYPCEADSTVVVYPDPVNAANKALLVDSASTAASATYYFTDVSEVFEVSVDVYVPTLSSWQIGLFPDQIEGRIQFAVTGDASGNLSAAATTVSTYNAAEWFNVRIVADPENEIADVYINGEAVATGVEYYGSGVGYGYSGGVYLSNKEKNGELYFDNLVTPIHDEVHVEKYIPEYIKTQILSSAEPDQCGHSTEGELLYSAFPSVKKVSDERVVIIFHRGVKHAYSHGVLDCIIYNPTTEEVIEQKVIYDDPDYNAQNADLMILPNGDLYITLNVQYPNSSADPYESLVFRSTDGGDTWTEAQQPTDQFGHHYSVVHDYAIVGNDVYMLAAKDPQLNNDDSLSYMCLVKSSDNCQTWEYVNNLTKELKYAFNESTIEPYDGKLLFVGRGDKKVTKAALLNLDGTAAKIRNIGVDFDCIDHNGKAEIFVQDGEYYLICRSILNDVGNAMELPLFRVDPETLSLETYVELQPRNTGTNGGDGFYAEGYMHEKDGELYLNVITYTRAYTNTSSGVPSIVRFEYKWDEVKNATPKENIKIDEVEAIKTDLSTMGRTETLIVDFDKGTNLETDYSYSQLGGTTTRSVKGLAATTADGTNDKLYCHLAGVNSTGAVYWAGSPTQETAIIFGKEAVVATGLAAAYELQPNRKYTVTYQVRAENAGSSFGFKGLNTYIQAEVSAGYTLASHAVESDSTTWVTYTDTFTTPDAATLGENKYLSFFVNKGSNSSVRLYIDNVTITAAIDATASDVVTFNDNGKLYYVNSADLTELPDGNNGAYDCEFEGWVDENGAVVTEVPANGTVLTAKYPIPNELPTTETETVTLGFDKLLTYKNISGNANGVSGIIAATPSSTVYSRTFGGNFCIKTNGTNSKNVVGLYLARDDQAYAGDQFGYILSPNTKYKVSFDECVTPLTEGTTVTYQLTGVRSSSSAVIASGLKLGDAVTVTAAGTDYTNHTVEFTTPSIAELGKNARLEIVITCAGTAETYSYSSYIDNVVISKTVEKEVGNAGATFLEYDGSFYYYNNGVLDRSTAVVTVDGTLYYVEEGKRSEGTKIVEYEGVCYYVKDGVVDTAATVGKTGDCYYAVDGTTLVIEGQGAVGAYSLESPAPWGTDITKVVLPGGVTGIGDYAFYGCTAIESVVYFGYTNDMFGISIGAENDPLTDVAWSTLVNDFEMMQVGSIRYEKAATDTTAYVSAGVRYRARVSETFRSSATELGFVVVPTELLNGKTLAEYVAQPDNLAKSAKVKADGMEEIVYAQGVDANGDNYYDYQMILTDLTRENTDANLLDTEMTVVMYAIVDGETVYTEPIAYSYADVLAVMQAQ